VPCATVDTNSRNEARDAGATKEEVERGDYTLSTLLRCESVVRAFEARHAHLRGSGWFALVVFLAQRDEEAVAARLARETAARDEKKAREKAATKTTMKTKRVTPTRVKKDEVSGGRSGADGAEGRCRRGGNGRERGVIRRHFRPNLCLCGLHGQLGNRAKFLTPKTKSTTATCWRNLRRRR
jgi:hypothetical protein